MNCLLVNTVNGAVSFCKCMEVAAFYVICCCLRPFAIMNEVNHYMYFKTKAFFFFFFLFYEAFGLV